MTSTPNSFRRLTGTPDIVRLEKKKTALLLIEFQNEHFTGNLPVQDAESLIAPMIKFMDWADKHKIMTVHIRHLAKSLASPVFAPDSEGADFHGPVVPGKKHFVQTKYASSAFSGSNLHTLLQSENIDTVILTGMSTPSSISASAHDANLLGYKCLVVSDLTASRDVMSWNETSVISAAQMQQTALANIADKYASVMTYGNVMALPLEK